MPTRREFLKVGMASAALLTVAGIAKAALPHRSESAAEPFAALDSGAREVLGAVIPVMLAGAGERVPVEAVVGSVERAVSGLPPHSQKEVRQLFALLSLGVTRRLVAGVSKPWPAAAPGDVAGFLQRWRTSRFALLQQGYQALHELVMASWYARPDAWPAIHYPGPPPVG